MIAPVTRAVDGLLEASVAGSFTRVGFVVRRRLEGWEDPPRLDDKVMVVTGASSGIGRATALGLARLGADVWLVGRDRVRLEATAETAVGAGATGRVRAAPVDLVDADAVGSFAESVRSTTDHLDGLVHSAGALWPRYTTAPDGSERTLATHVLAPFRLTWLLSAMFGAPSGSVIVTVSSGGMYTQRFDLDGLDQGPDGYNGVAVYARMKRAQVVLAHQWARRWGFEGVNSYAMHPGWVDTPGLAEGLPSFTRLGPLLRSPAEGADTAVWLAAGGPVRRPPVSRHRGRDRVPHGRGCDGIWLDRRRRSEFHLPWTRRSPVEQEVDGERLWAWCAARTGLDPTDPLSSPHE
jgi:dehydrogenase/reductase SDR family member 12